MYLLKITNEFPETISINEREVLPGENFIEEVKGNQKIDLAGIRTLFLQDLGDYKLDDYPLSETWGVLIQYKSVEAYYRYEDLGSLEITIDQLGTPHIACLNGSLIEVKLAEMHVQADMHKVANEMIEQINPTNHG